ncbi:hypothetical protein [Ancrocorticia sp.]|uniref:hypothetical protein n=1 Tax=Ancrocorticia sp. TaxID=2593684 RepID=UPI003F9196EF
MMGVGIAAGALAASVLLGWLAVEVVFKLARVKAPSDSAPRRGGYEATVLPESAPVEVLRGGTWIGVLERLAITGAILAGASGLIAAVVAIKGLGRWSELQRNPALNERFIIGTLASYLAAGACGFVEVWLS